MPTKKKNAKKIQVVLFDFLHPKKSGENGKHLRLFVSLLVVGVLWSPLGITDGGRVKMLHVLRVGIARKFAGPQNDSMGGQAEKKVKQLMLQKSGGHQFIWLPSLKQTART